MFQLLNTWEFWSSHILHWTDICSACWSPWTEIPPDVAVVLRKCQMENQPPKRRWDRVVQISSDWFTPGEGVYWPALRNYALPRCLNVMEISLPPLLRHRNPDFEPLIPNSRVFEAFEGFFKFERIFNHPHPLIQYPSSFWGSSCCFGVINLLPTCAPVFFRMSVVCFCAHKWASLKLNRYWLAWCRPTPRPGGSAPGLLNLDMWFIWFKYI